MQRFMLKSKLHGATVTQCNLHYMGSLTVDGNLLELADMRPDEKGGRAGTFASGAHLDARDLRRVSEDRFARQRIRGALVGE